MRKPLGGSVGGLDSKFKVVLGAFLDQIRQALTNPCPILLGKAGFEAIEWQTPCNRRVSEDAHASCRTPDFIGRQVVGPRPGPADFLGDHHLLFTDAQPLL